MKNKENFNLTPTLFGWQSANMQGVEEVSIDKYLVHSAKIDIEDLDWAEASTIGLTEDEQVVLTYFSDIEGQTIFYLRDLLNTKVALDPDAAAFLTMWNYEEFFHGQALTRLLNLCGIPLERDRIGKIRSTAQFSEKIEGWLARVASKILPDRFLSLYMTWGAMNELTTLRGYERLESLTKNSVLKTLCQRIAKQERRHFAWYFNSAQERLSSSLACQKCTRWGLHHFWTPVGAGVKKPEEVARVFLTLFPGSCGEELARQIDSRITTLPGLTGLSLMTRYLKQVSSPSRPQPGDDNPVLVDQLSHNWTE